VADIVVHDFRAMGPPRGLAALVGAQAVVVPLCGSKTAAAVAVDALRVVRWWRARVRFLDQHGWEATRPPPTVKHRGYKWRMLNCPPSAVAVSPSSLPCHLSTICPHCWGRWAIEQWQAIDLALFGKRRRPAMARALDDMSLVVRVQVFEAPLKSFTGRPTLPDLLARRIQLTRDPAWDLSTALIPTRDSDFIDGQESNDSRGRAALYSVR
jgi:hypothetical protein